MRQFFGKYRGKVENNIDPQQQGRIQVSVPAVLGDSSLSWAMPCAPFAGPGVGFFAVPPRGANVWVEFEGGNPDYPIWCGGFWGLGEVPALPALAEVVVLKTQAGTLKLSALPPPLDGVTLETASGMKISFSALGGLEITNGLASIKMEGPKVAINRDALEVLF